jgi:hypothetical protein
LFLAAIVAACLAVGAASWRLGAQTPSPAPAPATGIKYAVIDESAMKEWLTYLSSDELQGRQIFTEGYGMAAQYVAERLRQWGVKPIGDDHSYLQRIKMKGYKVTRNSSVTVEVNGQKRTFKQGDHVVFPVSSGGKQTLTLSGAQFAGSAAGAVTPDVKGKLVLWMNSAAPAGAAAAAPARGGGRGGGRGATPGAAALQQGAAAVIAFQAAPAPPSAAEDAVAKAQAALAQANDALTLAQQELTGRFGGRGAAGAGRGGVGGRGNPLANLQYDIAPTVQKVDGVVTPQFTGDETFFDFLLSGAPTKFADLKAKADKGEPLPAFSLPGATATITIDNAFEVISEQFTENVVGMIEGTDPALKNTYVMFGAHLDHLGYSQTGGGNLPSPSGCRRRSPAAIEAVQKAGKTVQNAGARGGGAAAAPVPFDQRDVIYNGADDDGSGTTAELAIAKAFATGPKPKRSIVFVWHTGEEEGLYGSRYNADFPIVPLDKVQAQLNTDMVGRDDCNDLEGDYSNSVFIVGADRISTDLHNLIVEQNTALTRPLTLDYELNDPNDPESVYTRSDHYSYAAKGIPIAFFTTGLHPDYHRVTDTVEKILFPKMARIAQLMYETGFSIADTDRVLVRDNKGPQTGFGSKAEVIKK